MVSKKEKIICAKFQFFDKYGKLPDEKVRIDVTLSKEVIVKMEGKNRSQYINSLVMDSSS